MQQCTLFILANPYLQIIEIDKRTHKRLVRHKTNTGIWRDTMTNTFKKFAIATIAAATMVTGAASANASGMNALASFKAETTVAKVGFFKKNGKFTNRGVAAIGVSSAIVGGLLASKAVKHREEKRARSEYVKPRRHVAKPRSTYKKPRRVAKKYYAPRVHKPVIAFNQNVYNQQTWLNQIGYNAGVADGKLGRNTRAAASQFQLANGMPATGYLTAPQTSLLAQHAAMVMAQRANPYPTTTVAAPALGYAAQPVAPAGYAPQVQHAPTTQVYYAPAPTVQHVPAPQGQYVPAPATHAPQVQHVAPTTYPAPVQHIGYAPTAQPQPQNYVPAVQY